VQREEDIVLEALVRKTEIIQRQLGSAGRVIAERIMDRLSAGGIRKGEARALAAAIEHEADDPRVQRARAEMDENEARRLSKVEAEIDSLRRSLERARKRVGVEPGEPQQVVDIALRRAGFPLDEAEREQVGKTSVRSRSTRSIQRSHAIPPGKMRSTICAPGAAVGASGRTSGAGACRREPSHSSRR
jgi:hypothetical protein